LAICLVCGKYEELGLRDCMKEGWVFARCPECQRGTPIDIALNYLAKSVGENNIEGFCDRHWFKDSGICGYCKMKREELRGESVD
jgi:hypothetical protein